MRKKAEALICRKSLNVAITFEHGHGLHHAQKAIDAHAGTISASSALGVGMSVII